MMHISIFQHSAWLLRLQRMTVFIGDLSVNYFLDLSIRPTCLVYKMSENSEQMCLPKVNMMSSNTAFCHDPKVFSLLQ